MIAQDRTEGELVVRALDRPGGGRQRLLGWAAILLGAVALLAVAHGPLLKGIAAALLVEDPLQPATAIIVLGGHLPFRAMEAAELYRAGWAPRVVIVRGAWREEHHALQALGVALREEWELTRDVLTRLGVPAPRVLVTPEVAHDTLEELAIAARALEPGTPVILVTSKVHARRVRLTWAHVTGGRSRGIVRPARSDPFDPNRWWRERRFALAVVREYLGLLNYWAGFPVAAQATAGGVGARSTP